MDENKYADIERELTTRIDEIRQRIRAEHPDNEAVINIFKAENVEFLKKYGPIIAEKGFERMIEEILNGFVSSGEATKVGDTYVKRKAN